MEGNGERWWGAVDKVVVVVRLCVCEREGWGGSKNPKTECGDSVSGVPCETVVWGNDGRLLVQVDGMEAAGGLHVCQCEASGWGLGQKPKTKCSWLGFGCVA
jgi:hypothetical protein